MGSGWGFQGGVRVRAGLVLQENNLAYGCTSRCVGTRLPSEAWLAGLRGQRLLLFESAADKSKKDIPVVAMSTVT